MQQTTRPGGTQHSSSTTDPDALDLRTGGNGVVVTMDQPEGVRIDIDDSILRLAVEATLRESKRATHRSGQSWVVTDQLERTGDHLVLLVDDQAGTCRRAMERLISGEISGIAYRSRPEQLTLIMEALEEGIVTIPDEVLASSKSAPTLDSRQARVLELLSHGASNQHIADELNVSEATVKREITRLLQLFNCSTRVELAMRSQASGYSGNT